MKRVLGVLIVGWAMISTVGCSSLVKNQTEQLRDDVARFNENVRWGRYRAAATQIPAVDRQGWLAAMEHAGRTFRILEYEVRPHQVKDDEAVVLVDITYHRHGGVVIERARRQQVWKRDGDWYLSAERQSEHLPEAEVPTKFPEFGSAHNAQSDDSPGGLATNATLPSLTRTE